MKRDFKQIDLGDNKFRYEIRMDSDSCVPGSPKGKQQQLAILKMITENPDLINCGPHPFDHLTLSHDGDRWQLYMEATGN